MTKTNKDKSLIWVYPSNDYTSECSQTFIYGYSNPKAELFCQVEACYGMHYKSNKAKKTKVKVFPNGNFAQVVKLPFKKNAIQMVQILNGKKKIITRNVIARRLSLTSVSSVEPSKPTKQSHNVRRSPRPFRARNGVLTICVDPGHGGKEHGTHSPKGIPEKIYNLQVSKMLVEALHATSLLHKQIYLTRSSDKFISLDDRISFAKKKKCDLFISIHHNALPDCEDPLKHRGVGIYYTHENVKPLAKKFLNNISKKSGLKKYGIFKRDFRVTKQEAFIGILIECGFLIHPIESEVVVSKKVQKKIVEGIVSSIW